MNEPILPDLPEGFYLAIGDGERSKVYEHCNGKWCNYYGECCADPRSMPWHDYTIHSIPALLSAAGERDALKVELAEARYALSAVEWQRMEFGIFCPECENTQKHGHTHDCNLAAVLAKAKS